MSTRVLTLKKVMMIFKGDYDNTATYQYADVVKYNGSSYVLKVETSIGVLPTNTTNWQLLIEKPIRGTDYFTVEDQLEMKTAVKTDVITDITPTLNNNMQASKDYTDNQNTLDIKDVTYNSITGVITFMTLHITA